MGYTNHDFEGPWLTLHFNAVESNVAELMCTVSGQPLGQSLLRVALSGNSRSCIAVQKSMLALTALHRFGLGFRAQELKVDAIRTLAAAAAEGVEVDSALQHVAAGMILCLFEVRFSLSPPLTCSQLTT